MIKLCLLSLKIRKAKIINPPPNKKAIEKWKIKNIFLINKLKDVTNRTNYANAIKSILNVQIHNHQLTQELLAFQKRKERF